jgi:hypothetical protein
VGIARFGDCAPMRTFPTGIFTRDRTGLSHQLARFGKSGQLADHRDNRDG